MKELRSLVIFSLSPTQGHIRLCSMPLLFQGVSDTCMVKKLTKTNTISARGRVGLQRWEPVVFYAT